MPELPEVETVKQGISPYILNQRIEKVIIRNHQLRWPISAEISHELVGQRFTHIARRGKYLLFHTAKGVLLLHLGMSGRLTLSSISLIADKHDHVDIVFSNQTCLRYTDPRRFGCILWIRPPALQHPLLKSLGPEPLENNFHTDYLYQRSRGSRRSVKIFIMDSKNVVGIGNIYANEILFLAQIHPEKIAGNLSFIECERLVAAIKEILQAAISQGGTTLKDFLSSDGTPGYFKQELKVYGRGHLPCYRCQKSLTETRQGQRTTVYCSYCQR